MKTFTDTVKLFFVLSGAVMGAGFLSGGELAVFFESRTILCVCISGAVFFAGFAFTEVKKDGFTEFVFAAADGVFACAMLTGLDEIAYYAGLKQGVPVASVLSLALFHFFLSVSIKKVEKANAVLIPLSVIAVGAAAICAKPLAVQSASSGAKNIINAVLYSCMNLFVALPSVGIAAKDKGRKAKPYAALAFTCVFIALACIILRVAPATAFPILDITRGTPFFPVLVCAVFIGSFTSLICYLYPLKNMIAEKTADKKRRGAYCFLLYFALFLLSRAGFNVIVKYLYPVIGALGLFSIVKSFFGIKKRGKGDTILKRSALCQERKRIKSKNLPKKNTAII